MRGTRRLAVSIALVCTLLTPALAIEPDDLPWDEIDRVLKEQPNSETAAPPQNANSADDRLQPAPIARPEPAKAEPIPAIAVTAPVPPAPQSPAATPLLVPTQGVTPAPTPQVPATVTVNPVTTPAPPATQIAAPPLAVPSTAVNTATVAVDGQLYLPIKRYFETKAAVTLQDYEEADRTALLQYYDAHMGQALWVSKDGFNALADNLISEIKKADDWGLASADYKIPGLAKIGSGEFPEEDLIDAEIKLSLVAMEYARHARGWRIYNPTEQLSSYIDRQPQIIEPAKVIESLASVTDKGAYLVSLHPKHEQFERLRQKLIALRKNTVEEEAETIPNGPNITAGKSHWQVALVRKRLKVPPPGQKPDGTAADENFYDNTLASAVLRYKEKYEIEPVNTTITAAVRSSLNARSNVSEYMLLANMEEWRWMPEDLGSTHVAVNIPEFLVRVVKNNKIIHEERIVSGKYETQTPIFSDNMRTIVFQPPWNVPESIKYNELLPKLRDGGNPIERQGLVIKRNGHDVDVWDIDWSRADIRQYTIYQPPGDANVLGIVKFLFPNKHSVYLHDTPSKRLFNEKVRMFSHGCMRVRNPVRLAEVLLKEDKGWGADKIEELITTGPEDNDISLDHPMPVHVTYFTAWVDENGEIKTFADVYGHEKRIVLGLEGRWGEIVKNRDHLLPPEGSDEAPQARNRDDWGDNNGDEDRPVRRSRPARVTYREPPPLPPQQQVARKKGQSVGDLLQKMFGGY